MRGQTPCYLVIISENSFLFAQYLGASHMYIWMPCKDTSSVWTCLIIYLSCIWSWILKFVLIIDVIEVFFLNISDKKVRNLIITYSGITLNMLNVVSQWVLLNITLYVMFWSCPCQYMYNKTCPYGTLEVKWLCPYYTWQVSLSEIMPPDHMLL